MMKILTNKDCKYCNELKDRLNKEEVEYIDIDIDDVDNKEICDKIFKLTNEPLIPIILIGPRVLAPKHSFTTIEDAIILIRRLT